MDIAPLPDAVDEPMVYLSCAQVSVIANYPLLRNLSLPCWIPQRRVADALGFDHHGIERAQQTVGGPYLWATELENVHSLWHYDEPSLCIEGEWFECSEEYYHAQKPSPFNAKQWEQRREGIMEQALRAKLNADPSLVALLRTTHPFPLLSLKNDETWGFHPERGGRNLLAQIWEKLRKEIVDGGRRDPAPG